MSSPAPNWPRYLPLSPSGHPQSPGALPAPQGHELAPGWGAPMAAAWHPGLVPGDSRALQTRGQQALSLGFVLFVLKRWWKLGLPLALLLSALACGAICLLFQPVYQARAWLRIEESEPYIVRPGVMGGGQLDRFVRTQVQLLKSPIVLDRVLADPEIARLPELREQLSPLDWLAEKIQVESLHNSELFQIVFQGPDPRNSAALVNAVLESYLRVQSDAAASQTQHIVDLLDKEMDRRQRELERLKNSVRALHKLATGHEPGLMVSGSESALVQVNPLADLENRILESETRRGELETRLKAFREQMQGSEQSVPEDEIEEVLENDLESHRLTEALVAAQTALAADQAVLRANDPKLTEQQGLIQQLQAELARRQEKLKARVSERFAQREQRAYDDRVKELAVEIQAHAELERALVRKLGDKQKELEKLGSHSLDLEFTRGELERAEQIYKLIADRAEALKTEMVAPNRVRELRRAEVPGEPLELLPMRQLVAAGLATFCFPFALAVLWEFKVRRIAESHQIAAETELPVLGEVTMLPIQMSNPNVPVPKRWEQYRNTFQESIDYVRTALTLSNKLGAHQVLAVASAVSREGKSSLASQLAVSLAQAAEAPVLLIDADLRAPDLHDWLGVGLSPGLSQLLASQAEPGPARQVAAAAQPGAVAPPGVAEPADGSASCPPGRADRVAPSQAIVATWCPNLYFLPAGTLDRPPQLLLGDGKFKALLETLKPQYRYIVVDAPPVLPTSDALIIANAADGTLLATMRNVSRSQQLQTTCQRLRAAGANLLGAVLSGVPWRSYAYNYGSYGYGYGYGYGSGGYGESRYPSLASHLHQTAAQHQAREAGAGPSAASVATVSSTVEGSSDS